MPITTNIVSLNADHFKLYSIHYVMKFVSDLRQIGGFHQVLVSSTNKTDRHDITEKLLKVTLNTITLTLKLHLPFIYLCINEDKVISI
jgi:hypothetical protein